MLSVCCPKIHLMIKMKKTLFFCILTVLQIYAFAGEKFLTFSTGLTTGIPIYAVNNEKSDINSDSSASDDKTAQKISTQNKIVIGTFGTANFNVIRQASFFAGVDLLCDFNFNSDEYNNFLHLDFPVGFKFYPNLGGLNLSVAYALGLRINFYKSTGDGSNCFLSSWGNGFKFGFEYDFSYGSKHNFLPAIGCNWTFMPRGNYSYDNIFTFYISETF